MLADMLFYLKATYHERRIGIPLTCLTPPHFNYAF